jgi:hypothetical protein
MSHATHLSMMVLPMGVDPVKPSLRMSMCSENAWPTTEPAQKTIGAQCLLGIKQANSHNLQQKTNLAHRLYPIEHTTQMTRKKHSMDFQHTKKNKTKQNKTKQETNKQTKSVIDV